MRGPTPRPESTARLAARDAMSRGARLPKLGYSRSRYVVALGLGDLVRRSSLVRVRRHPHAAVVAQRLRHQRELRLEVVGLRDAGRVDLRVARVGEVGALAVRPPCCGHVARHRVGRQEERVAVAAGGEHDGVAGVAAELAGEQVTGDDAGGAALDSDDVDELDAVPQLHAAEADLTGHLLVGAEQQLLAGLAAGVERAHQLRAAETPGVEEAAVLAGERHALGDHLVDDVHRHLRQAVDVRLTRAEVAALDRVVEQPVDAVAVAAVVLGGVDAALGGDRVRPPRRVVERERLDVVAELGQRRGSRGAGEAGADDEHLELALVVRVDELGVALELVPLVLDRAVGDLRVERRGGEGVGHHCSFRRSGVR